MLFLCVHRTFLYFTLNDAVKPFYIYPYDAIKPFHIYPYDAIKPFYIYPYNAIKPFRIYPYDTIKLTFMMPSNPHVVFSTLISLLCLEWMEYNMEYGKGEGAYRRVDLSDTLNDAVKPFYIYPYDAIKPFHIYPYDAIKPFYIYPYNAIKPFRIYPYDTIKLTFMMPSNPHVVFSTLISLLCLEWMEYNMEYGKGEGAYRRVDLSDT